jgi:ribose 5-phosphate isomerase B
LLVGSGSRESQGVPSRGGTMRIAFGTNRHGYAVQGAILSLLGQLGHEVIDVGACDAKQVDYPDIAAAVARQVARKEAARGILVGGTGLGMCIVANKFPGVRAALCPDALAAENARRHHDVNVLCVPAGMLGERSIRLIVETWLATPFDAACHTVPLEKISRLEQEINRLP